MSIDRMKELTATINALTEERRALGGSLPPVTFDEVKNDRAFEQAVREWMRVWMPSIDSTLLDRNDYDKWELLTQRYEERDGRVFDTHEGEFVEDEDADMDDLEREWRDTFCGFPFAWNTAWTLEGEHWTDELSAAGFLVYRYDGDTIIAGIDGGGYAFMDAHFKPLYAALAAQNGWLIETVNGPRLITNDTKKED